MFRHRIAPAPAPHQSRSWWDPWPPSPSPATSTQPPPSFTTSSSAHVSSPPPSKLSVDFSPPLIAMVVIIATAFVVITYSRLLSRHCINYYRRYRRWRRRRRRYLPSTSGGEIESPPHLFDPTDAFHVLSPYGLDETIIKTIPLSVYTRKSVFQDCAVCLLEFEEHDYVRTLPICSHAFHVDCIDIWLRSHANCPLCRASVFTSDSPFTPLMAARIRPSLEDIILESTILEPLTEILIESEAITEGEITQEQSPRRSNQSEDRFNRRDFLLKRSYSFSFERNLGSERLVLEATTASPWRYRRGGAGGGSFWSKRPSPFSSIRKHRVFSFRYYRGMKSPFFRRRSMSGFYPMSESSVRLGSSRRSKSFASPMFIGGWSDVFVEPAEERRSRGIAVTGEI